MQRLVMPILTAMWLFGASAMAGAETVVVVIRDYKFTPPEVTIKPGDTVRWENHEKRQYHSVWFEATGDPEPDYFFPEETYERVFESSGSFPYHCGPHPEMTGMVQVSD